MYAETTTTNSNAAYAAFQEYDEEHHGGAQAVAAQITPLMIEPTAVKVDPAYLLDALPGDGDPPGVEDLPIHQKRLLFVWIIIASALYVVFVLTCLMASLMGVMMFDSGVNMKTLTTFWIGEAIIFSLAGLAVYNIVFMWRNYNRREYKKVLLASLIPILLYALANILV
jgi:hypothetical protein